MSDSYLPRLSFEFPPSTRYLFPFWAIELERDFLLIFFSRWTFDANQRRSEICILREGGWEVESN